MKKTFALLAAGLAAGALLAACSGDYCSRVANLNLSSKQGTCNFGDGGFSVSTCKNTNTCETGLKSCSSDDQATLNKGVDCLNNLPSCTAGQEQQWGGQVLSCFTSNAPSSACSTALANAGADGGC